MAYGRSLLSDALKAKEWKRLRDPARKEQDVAPLFRRKRGRKRKSACSEYELTNTNKRLRLGEHGHNKKDDEEHDDREADEDVDVDEEDGVAGDEHTDNDGDNEEIIV